MYIHLLHVIKANVFLTQNYFFIKKKKKKKKIFIFLN